MTRIHDTTDIDLAIWTIFDFGFHATALASNSDTNTHSVNLEINSELLLLILSNEPFNVGSCRVIGAFDANLENVCCVWWPY